MKTIFQILIFLFIAGNAFSQGFNWQYDFRMPFDMPDSYVGVYGDFNYNTHFGDFPFLEESVPCCNFSDGTGTGFKIGISGEYWLDEDIAIGALVSYSLSSAEFAAEKTMPRLHLPDLVTEYVFEADYSFVDLQFLGKIRIANTHAFVGVGLGIEFLISSDFSFHEKIISPPEDYFKKNGLQRREIIFGDVGEQASVLINPKILAGYNFDLGRGKYASPMIYLNYSYPDMTDAGQWKRIAVGIALSVNLISFEF